MRKLISPSEKQALFDKRQNLFALLHDSENTSNELSAPVPPLPRRPAQTAPVPRQAEEVQDMLRKFVNPNADRWSLF